MTEAGIIVIDIYSVVPELQTPQLGTLRGTPVPGLVDYVKAEQNAGSSIFFIAGGAYDPWMRQQLERLLEGFGIRGVFVTHGLPDGFTLFISKHAWRFDEHFPIQT
jgi:hypothetical protein